MAKYLFLVYPRTGRAFFRFAQQLVQCPLSAIWRITDADTHDFWLQTQKDGVETRGTQRKQLQISEEFSGHAEESLGSA